MSTAPPPYSEKMPGGAYQIPPNGPPPMQVGAPIFILTDYPVQCVCPHCRQTIVTRTEKENGILTWILVLVLALCGLFLGCCLIPLCVDGCKDTVHYCPNCSVCLGTKKIL